MKPSDIDDFVVWCALGIILGGRVGYVLFYDFPRFTENPLEIFAALARRHVVPRRLPRHDAGDGRSSRASRRHPGLVADRRHRRRRCTFGLFLGRLANFINGELYGRATDVPWAMVFPDGGPEPRHPSQLYEALLEGIVLFIVLRILTNRLGKLRQPGFVSGAFAVGYGVGAHLRRVLPRARHPDRLPRRRPHHGHGCCRSR